MHFNQSMEVGDAGSDMEATDDYHIDQSDQTTLAKTILTLGGIALTICKRKQLHAAAPN
jgi:hypothetical protein